ncbi:MAG: hypothetical protein VX505_11405 [Chloroflexota bacterium]|nr:hypothetical protein [Chloroflexota bacterium]
MAAVSSSSGWGDGTLPYAGSSSLYRTALSASRRTIRRASASSGVNPSRASSKASFAILNAFTAAGIPP